MSSLWTSVHTEKSSPTWVRASWIALFSSFSDHFTRSCIADDWATENACTKLSCYKECLQCIQIVTFPVVLTSFSWAITIWRSLWPEPIDRILTPLLLKALLALSISIIGRKISVQITDCRLLSPWRSCLKLGNIRDSSNIFDARSQIILTLNSLQTSSADRQSDTTVNNNKPRQTQNGWKMLCGNTIFTRGRIQTKIYNIISSINLRIIRLKW